MEFQYSSVPFMGCVMKKTSILLLSVVCLISQGIAQAHDPSSEPPLEENKGKIGQGVLCDSREHIMRFVALRGSGEDGASAIERVNYESRDTGACRFAVVLFVDDEPVVQVAVKARLFTIVQITVNAFEHGPVWISTAPLTFYTARVEKGLIV